MLQSLHRFIDLSVFYKSGLEFCSTQVRNVSADPGKVHFEGWIHLSRYIRDNKTLVLKYYADLNDAPVSDLLRQASIKKNNYFMAISDSS